MRWLCFGLAVAASGKAADVAPPPMGWNSWNWHGKPAINEGVVRETIDAMVATGLRDAGYRYVIVDGGWRATRLAPNGELMAHAVKFPGGMKALADYAHERGLKLGVHTVPGTNDCGGDPVGGYGHEEVQVREFAAWGLDFIKLDKCRFSEGWTEDKVHEVYAHWAELLRHADREMVFSISAYTYRDWYPGTARMARTTADIRARIHGGAVFDQGPTDTRGPLSVMAIADINDRAAKFAGNGYWNDPDMMVTGGQGLTPDEERAHFALWCVMTAPLMLGDDPRHLTPLERDILLNRECLAVDQDTTEQGRRVRATNGVEVWVKRLAGDRAAVLLLNRDAHAAKEAELQPADVPLKAPWRGRDLFRGEDLPAGAPVRATLPPHGAWFLLVTRG